MKKINRLEVWYENQKVGSLVDADRGYTAFQYSNDWLENGFSISPFILPLEKKVFIPNAYTFDGIFGVFSDSLPDGWGRLIVDRMLKKNHLNPDDTSNIQRLAIVGNSGMGGLSYRPEMNLESSSQEFNLDYLSKECEKILLEEESSNLDELFLLGGSSGGARPKILTSHDDEDWIIKFPSTFDSKDIGNEEFCYMKCAEECGINIEKINLFHSEICSGYFGIRRFDRRNGERNHMITASGLLETSHRIPNLDYNDLMKLTWLLTKNLSQLEELYRRMCFNVFSHNRDDHSKNFTFLYDNKNDKWVLSPAYDLTYSNSIGGEHATTINGNGKNPDIKDLLEVGKNFGLSNSFCKICADDIRVIVNERLSKYVNKK